MSIESENKGEIGKWGEGFISYGTCAISHCIKNIQ